MFGGVDIRFEDKELNGRVYSLSVLISIELRKIKYIKCRKINVFINDETYDHGYSGKTFNIMGVIIGSSYDRLKGLDANDFRIEVIMLCKKGLEFVWHQYNWDIGDLDQAFFILSQSDGVSKFTYGPQIYDKIANSFFCLVREVHSDFSLMKIQKKHRKDKNGIIERDIIKTFNMDPMIRQLFYHISDDEKEILVRNYTDEITLHISKANLDFNYTIDPKENTLQELKDYINLNNININKDLSKLVFWGSHRVKG